MSGMIDAFRIGVEMALFDKVTPELAKLTKRLGTVNKDMDKVIKSTSLVNKEFTKWMETAKQLNASLRAMSDRFGRMGRVADEAALNLNANARAANSVAVAMERAAAASKAYSGSMATAGRASIAGRGAVMAGGGFMPASGGGGRRGGGVPPVIPAPRGGGGHGRGGHMHIGPHGVGLAGASVALGDFAAPAIGAAMVGGFAMHAYKEYGHYQAGLHQLGGTMSPADVARIDSYLNTNRFAGLDRNQAMELFGQAYSIMMDKNEALEVFPSLAKMKVSLDAKYPGKFGEKEFDAFVRVAEMRGGPGNTKRFLENLEAQQRAMELGQGKLSPSHYLGAMQTGGNYFRMQSDDNFYYGNAANYKEQGGSKTGTGAYSLFQNWALGKMTQATKDRLIGMGLGTQDMIKGAKGKTKPGAFHLKNLQQFLHDDNAWIRDTYIPALKAHGITNMQQNIFEAASDVGIRTAGNYLALKAANQTVIARDLKFGPKMPGISQAYGEAQQLNTQQMKTANAAWHDFTIEIGKLVSPAISKGLKEVAGSLNTLTSDIQLLGATANKVGNLIQSIPGVGLGQRVMGKVNDSVGQGGFFHGLINTGRAALNWFTDPASRHPKVPAPGGSSHSSPAHVFLDGHKVGQVLDRNAARRANGPMIGGVGLDTSMSYLPTSIAGGT